ncbi:hypothetical protein DOK76_04580 [Vagococcus sp. DIV0080]|uniref:Uncharacterized protein n=1 Tax=Candidatus Vagococcus giribetii TaxID=2230876 RepID=A0ABS3HRE7_9ENTE|nr:hypothetical protein [Vagococcus sp. DIV0080]MBO0476333.1 hypothetical protein [Vagococcus sp. DIV0080]
MDLTNKLKEQYMNYRDILKANDVVGNVKETVPFISVETSKNHQKENSRKWQAKLY